MLNLNGIWDLEPKEECGIRKVEADVPGDVLLPLMKHGIIPDPTVRDHFLQCKWVGEHTWIYSRTFSGSFPEGWKHVLVFEGLIYKAAIFLNGRCVAEHKNMHRPLQIDVSRFLLQGENRLEVHLAPYDPAELKTPVIRLWNGWSGAIADQGYCFKRGAARRADYLTGWDWTQGLPVCGIWRDVHLESIRDFRIAEPHLIPRNNGDLLCRFRLESILNEIVTTRCILRIRKRGETHIAGQSETELILGPGTIDYEIRTHVDSPELWYPAGYGPHPLYECEIEIPIRDTSVKRTVGFAFREFAIREEACTQKQGVFQFLVNGQNVFARGANWIPPDIIPCRATEERYRHLLNLAVLGNLNYLRFWGGGFFENDLFYDLCDEYGILIWQDLMFGGEEIPEFDPAFRRECLEEIRENVTRLRNHPSIVVWCGSNETDDFFCPDGGHIPPRRPEGRYYGYRLLHQDLPPRMRELVPNGIYIPSCPTRGAFAPPGTRINAWGFGTTHRNFLHQYESDACYDAQNEVPAFVNEAYGVSPDPDSSLRRYLSESDLTSYRNSVFSEHNIMDLQRNNEWSLFFRYLTFHHESRRFELPLPELFELFTEAHGELVKRYTEFLRRNLRYAGGIAFWMYNSAYPMSGWSWIDYYGVPKAVFYAAKRAYRPILPIPAIYEEHCEVTVSNLSDYEGDVLLETSLLRFDGKKKRVWKTICRLRPNRSVSAQKITRDEMTEFPPEESFLSAVLLIRGERVENHRFFVPPRERRIPDTEVVCLWKREDPTLCILRSRGFAENVRFPECSETILPDDNAFDLCPGEEKRVRFLTPLSREPEISWTNRNASPRLVWKEEESTNGQFIRHLTVFNPSERPVRLRIRAEGENVLADPETEVTLQGHETKKLSLHLVPRPFQASPCALPLRILLGDTVLLDRLEADSPIEIHDGAIHWSNPLQLPLPIPESEYCIVGQDLQEYRCRIPAKELLPGEKWRLPLEKPSDALPFTAALRIGGRIVSAFWDESSRFERSQLALLPCREFDGILPVYPSPHGFPVLTEQAGGTLVHPGDGMRGRLFLSRTPGKLHLHLFLENVPQDQPFENEDVYRASCVELGFFDQERKCIRDYSLARTFRGDQLFLRRGSPGFSKGLRDHLDGELKIRLLPENVVYYALVFDTVSAGLEELLQSGEFHLRLHICWPGFRFSLSDNSMDLTPVRVLEESPAISRR